jgi:hypothetical protein
MLTHIASDDEHLKALWKGVTFGFSRMHCGLHGKTWAEFSSMKLSNL